MLSPMVVGLASGTFLSCEVRGEEHFVGRFPFTCLGNGMNYFRQCWKGLLCPLGVKALLCKSMWIRSGMGCVYETRTWGQIFTFDV